MFHISWDKETGGVLLSSKVAKDTLGISPRPVFREELDLLGLDKLGWKYPHCEEPLLWAQNKQYYYRGELMFEAKGANIYDAPTVVFAPGKESEALEPVDVAAMLERNADLMFLLESEAIEFIRDVFVTYASASKSVDAVKANQMDFEAMRERLEKKTKTRMAIVKGDCDSFDIMPLDTAKAEGKRVYQGTKIDRFIASFSGGKDSQVILDLCTRAIPSTEFEVIYSDTGYELPPSLELFEYVKQYYGERFPRLKFSLARNHESVLNYWDKIGTPSDTHRWCCKVMKTAPLYRSLKVEGNKQARVLAFEGVRAEESARRNEYLRIGKGVKHSTTINARPIFNWNVAEVFLYLLKYSLPINPAYRVGKARVGCLICPFSSTWDDMMVHRCYKKELQPFLDKLYEGARLQGVKDIDNYIKERNWKFRASGNAMRNDSRITFVADKANFRVKVINPKQSLFSWITIIGKISYNQADSETMAGEIVFDKNVYSFEYKSVENGFEFNVFNTASIKLISLLRRIIYKTTYCINCETCEVECPTGALSVYPSVSVDSSKCVHCFRCLEFHDKGCIVANSIDMTNGTSLKSKTGIDRYSTFGLHEEWLDEFLSDPESYWSEISLGKKQVSSVKAWLKEAEIVDAKLCITDTGKLLTAISHDSPVLVWEIILTNLAYNSFIVGWALKNIGLDTPYDRNYVDESIKLEYGDAYGLKTIQNARAAFMQLLKYSPIGETLLVGVEDGKMRVRHSYDDVSIEAIAYSIYKYAQAKDISFMRVSDFYRPEETSGPYREFGISKAELMKKLRALSSDSNRVLIAELNMGLDHITLREDLTPLTALAQLTK